MDQPNVFFVDRNPRAATQKTCTALVDLSSLQATVTIQRKAMKVDLPPYGVSVFSLHAS